MKLSCYYRDSSHTSYAASETNCALETDMMTLLPFDHCDLLSLPQSPRLIYALAPLHLSVLWDRFVQLIHSLLQLGLNLHLMFAKSS